MQEDGLECGSLAVSKGTLNVVDLDVMWLKDLHLERVAQNKRRSGARVMFAGPSGAPE